MLVILLIFSILLLVLQYKPVQTWAAKKAAAYLSEKLKTEVGIKSLYVQPFSSVMLEGLYVLDKQKDTLLSTPKLEIDLNDFSLFSSIKNKIIDFKMIQIDNGSAYLKKQKDSLSNLQFIIDAFSGPKDTVKSKPWHVEFEKIALNNFHFRFKNMLVDTVIKGINFDDLDVKQLSLVVKDMDLTNHLFPGLSVAGPSARISNDACTALRLRPGLVYKPRQGGSPPQSIRVPGSPFVESRGHNYPRIWSYYGWNPSLQTGL